MIPQSRPTWAEISLPSLRYNFRRLAQHVAPQATLMAVLKANAYGHGAVECARALEADGAEWFGVALVEEAVELRRAGIRQKIFCLGGSSPGQGALVADFDLTPAVFRWDQAVELNHAARERGKNIPVHIKVDTGMGRLGIPVGEVAAFADRISQLANLRVDGILSHLATADEADTAHANLQIARFNEALSAMRDAGVVPTWRHLANSAALHAHPASLGNLVRAGASLYGLEEDVFAQEPAPLGLKPVLSLRSSIVLLKDVPRGTALGYGRTFTTERTSRIATLPIGYADGLRRAHSNRRRVIVRGSYAPVVGRISMDLTLVDVTDIPGVSLGDEVVLIGTEDGLSIRVEELAREIGTISYEIVCGISPRVPRIHSS
jgi:alanine racemase